MDSSYRLEDRQESLGTCASVCRHLVYGWDVFDFENHSGFFVLKFYWTTRFVYFYFSVYFIIKMLYFTDKTNKQK